MNCNRYVCLLFLAFCALFLSFVDNASSDTIDFTIESYGADHKQIPGQVKNVFVVSQDADSVTYYDLHPGGYVRTDWIGTSQSVRGGAPKDFKVKFSSLVEKKELLDKWRQKANFSEIERRFGPSIKLVACGIKYPLPEDVNYIMGSPGIKMGTEFYVGQGSSDINKVTFKEIIDFEIKKGGQTVNVTWRNSEKSEGPLLGSWEYGAHMGAPAVIFGMDYDNYRYMEIPLKSVKKVTFSGYEIVQCKGNPEHKFIAPLPTWKYCPFDGMELVKRK